MHFHHLADDLITFISQSDDRLVSSVREAEHAPCMVSRGLPNFFSLGPKLYACVLLYRVYQKKAGRVAIFPNIYYRIDMTNTCSPMSYYAYGSYSFKLTPFNHV